MNYKINKYPDGTSYIVIEKFNYNVAHLINNVYASVSDIVFKTNSYEDLWCLNQLVDAFNFNKVKPTIIIPNLIDAQADRRFAENQSSGLKLVCKFLNEMNANFKIFHPHNPEVVEALMDNVEIIDNNEFIIEVLDSLANPNTYDIKNWRKELDNLILMSSDAGGFKTLMKLCDKINWQGETVSANKSRRFINNKSDLTQGVDRDDYQGKDILIIDDISVYGGTFKGLSKLLRERNCGKLYLVVSHITVQNLGIDPVTNYFDKVFTTNSKFDNYTANSGFVPQNLEIIKLF